MRIIGGRLRGRKLTGPEGVTARPTGERAREALFDILAHGRFGDNNACSDAMVLDAFAGTGAFGLEALSRGARHASFMEKDYAARYTLKKNAAALGETQHATILAADATRPPRASGPCTLTFLDPPYREDLATPALDALVKAGWIAHGALVIVEMATRDTFDSPEGFSLLEKRRYGTAKFVFLRYGTTA